MMFPVQTGIDWIVAIQSGRKLRKHIVDVEIFSLGILAKEHPEKTLRLEQHINRLASRYKLAKEN